VTVRFVAVIGLLILLGACTTQEVRYAHTVPLALVQAPYPESELLDVGVVVFNSGIPEGELDREQIEELMQDGTFIQVRRAEAIMLANRVSETLSASGHWGGVWVTPRESTAVDLNVTAEILQSDGNVLEMRVRAVDATGHEWLSKKYYMETAASAYNRFRYPNTDPYQDVFNEISNDLASLRAQVTPEQLADIRSVSELRYAAELSPAAFGDYIEESGNGSFRPQRLPAADDPMLQRSRSVRQREQLLFETLDQYYQEFSREADDSYFGWREYSREDSIRIEEAARAAKSRTALGALAIALSVAASNQIETNSLADTLLVNSGIYIGGDLLRSAAVRRQERRLYTQSLEELSASFDQDVKPLVVDVQGTEHRLTGTAERQYEEWQRLLQEIFISETGLVPEDIRIYAEPDVEAPPDAAAAPESQEGVADANGGTGTDA